MGGVLGHTESKSILSAQSTSGLQLVRIADVAARPIDPDPSCRSSGAAARSAMRGSTLADGGDVAVLSERCRR